MLAKRHPVCNAGLCGAGLLESQPVYRRRHPIMALSNVAKYQTKLFQIVFGLALFFLSLYLVQNVVSSGQRGIPLLKTVIGATVLFFLLVKLDKRYWILTPFLSMFDFRFPVLPFSGFELGELVVVGVFFFRLVCKRDNLQFRFRDILPALPVLLWMVFVFCLNPTGFYIFGGEKIGARFYFQVVLGFATLFVFSSFRFDERDAKFLFFSFVFGAIFSFGLGFSVFSSRLNAGSHYELNDSARLLMLLLSRYTMGGVLSSFGRFFVVFLLSLVVVYTGKRRLFGTMALIPVLRTFLSGRERALALLVILAGSFAVLFGVAGDGQFYTLPPSAKRALSVIVPTYRNRADEGFVADYFRERVRSEARSRIAENPWFGRKGFAMDLEETTWIIFGGGRTDVYEGSVNVGNLHSTWYAFASDFGIPCMVLWGIFNIWLLWWTFRACRTVIAGTWLPACCLYLSMWVWISFAFSYTSGHSAITSNMTWVAYGYLIAVFRGYQSMKQEAT